jgi:F-type H+-transporting ATPase subunit c
MRKYGMVIFWTLFFLLLPALAFAADEAVAAAGAVGKAGGFGIGAGLAVGAAGLGCGIGQGITGGLTTSGIARNPGAAGNMFLYFILAMAFIESIALYGLVVAFSIS